MSIEKDILHLLETRSKANSEGFSLDEICSFFKMEREFAERILLKLEGEELIVKNRFYGLSNLGRLALSASNACFVLNTGMPALVAIRGLQRLSQVGMMNTSKIEPSEETQR